MWRWIIDQVGGHTESSATHLPRVVEDSAQLSMIIVVLEYQSLRNEAEQALHKQQTIIQYLLATGGVLLAATVAVQVQNPIDSLPVALLVFGLLGPGLSILAGLSWLGELYRQERAGYYLRGLERHVWQHLRGRSDILPTLENAISVGSKLGGVGKRRVGYLGAGGVLTGTVVVSMILFLVTMYYPGGGNQVSVIWLVAAWIWSVVVVSAYFAFMIRQSFTLLRISRRWAGPDLFDPAKYPTS